MLLATIFVQIFILEERTVWTPFSKPKMFLMFKNNRKEKKKNRDILALTAWALVKVSGI